MVRNIGLFVLAVLASACGGEGDPGEPGERGEAGDPGETGETGEAGEPGPPGESLTVAALAVGDANCPAGGTAFTVSSTTTYACNGVDGGRAEYGDGSLRAMAITSDTNWSSTPPPSFEVKVTDFSVAAGVTLRVPSGMVIRATGTFNNEGTILVEPFSFDAGAGAGRSGFGKCAESNAYVAGGGGGIGLDFASAQLLRYPGQRGGGGGAASNFGPGTRGGGTLVVAASGAITTDGTIDASGQSGSDAVYPEGTGGGGGGIILLASATSVVNTGVLQVQGGSGGEATSGATGPGGGGSGGVIRLLAPIVTEGATDVSGGAAGVLGVPSSSFGWCSGGGGGAGYSGGGRGSSVGSNGVFLEAGEGSYGAVFTTLADPTLTL